MIADKRLQELIDIHEGYNHIMQNSSKYLEAEYNDLLSSLKELQTLRQQNKELQHTIYCGRSDYRCFFQFTGTGEVTVTRTKKQVK